MSRLAYLGTPELAVPPLRALVGAGHDLALVVTRPDRRRGRGSQLSPSPLKAAAQELGLPVTHDIEEVRSAGVELGVVVAYGRIIPGEVLADVPMVNLHFSLLPRWRGAAPVERAILAGDPATGVSVMEVEEGLDTGRLYASRALEIGPEESLDELRRRLVEAGTGLLVELLAGGRAGLPVPRPQVGEPSYAAKIEPGELELHWERPGADLERLVRLGRAWTTWRGGRLRVLRASLVPAEAGPGRPSEVPPGTLVGDRVATGDGWLRLLEVHPEGRGPLSVPEWLRGVRPDPTERLGDGPP